METMVHDPMNASEEASLVQVQNMSFGYGRSRLFEGMNLSLSRGAIVGLLGKNGEGKTTLLKLLSGLLRSRKGAVLLSGEEVRTRPTSALSNIYYLPEEVRLPDTSVGSYLSSVGRFYPHYDVSVASSILESFDLPLHLRLRHLSMGQKKKVALTLALSLRVPLLLLDEPTNGLDIPSKSIFRQMLVKYISEEQTVVISTHQVRDLEQMIDHLVVLHENRVLCNESIHRLGNLFYCGPVDARLCEEPIYSEPTLYGPMGVYDSREGMGDGAFSMELFFNALISRTDHIVRRLGAALGEK